MNNTAASAAATGKGLVKLFAKCAEVEVCFGDDNIAAVVFPKEYRRKIVCLFGKLIGKLARTAHVVRVGKQDNARCAFNAFAFQ